MATALTVLDSPATTCCSLITGGAMSSGEAASLASKFKAMGDPTRLRLLSLVAAHEDGEACVCDLNEPLDLSQPTVSHHLKILVDAGLLSRTKRGTWSYYALVPGALPMLADTLRA
jgi:ArsR family transcriptional regulator